MSDCSSHEYAYQRLASEADDAQRNVNRYLSAAQEAEDRNDPDEAQRLRNRANAGAEHAEQLRSRSRQAYQDWQQCLSNA